MMMYDIEEEKPKHATGLLGIDYETADRITRLNLTEYRDRLQEELDKWNGDPKSEHNPDGYWLHSEDVVTNYNTIKIIDTLLEHFGGELYA
jgi:hypothetical protein